MGSIIQSSKSNTLGKRQENPKHSHGYHFQPIGSGSQLFGISIAFSVYPVIQTQVHNSCRHRSDHLYQLTIEANFVSQDFPNPRETAGDHSHEVF